MGIDGKSSFLDELCFIPAHTLVGSYYLPVEVGDVNSVKIHHSKFPDTGSYKGLPVRKL